LQLGTGYARGAVASPPKTRGVNASGNNRRAAHA
jgi:hypothetical protein